MGAEMRAKSAREVAEKASRRADRGPRGSVVAAHGGLGRVRTAVSNDQPVPTRRPKLAGG